MAKSGFATIIGRPNVGKSTLMNTLIGQKIAITSYKPQTTRTQIRTIYTEERGQVVFLDTPGMFGIASAQTGRFEDPLNEYMYRAAESTMKEVDLILWLVEPKVPLTDEDKALMKVVASASSKTPVILVMTKVDSFKKEKILPAISVYAEEWKTLTGSELSDIIPVSS
ncbi:MAG: GTPase Era, partial [Lachnospiraceae bacterium]|nr:GTPase Era [Lachnospiraceae bacterium]